MFLEGAALHVLELYGEGATWMTLERFHEDVTGRWALRITAVALRDAIPQVLMSGRTFRVCDAACSESAMIEPGPDSSSLSDGLP